MKEPSGSRETPTGEATRHGEGGPLMPWIFTDTHAHLEMLSERLGEAAAASVLATFALAERGSDRPPLLVDPGVEPADLVRRIRLAEKLLASIGRQDRPLPSWLRHAAGVWPGKPALDDPEGSVVVLKASIAEALTLGVEIAAIGECGLDFHHMEAPEAVQRRLFQLQIELAESLGLPLIVHSRDAAGATLAALGDSPSRNPVVIHCFGYGPEEARAFLAAGCHISFAGNLGYKKAEAMREALGIVPDERLLLETDAPYMNPEPRRGKPSSPLDVDRSYAVAAAIRGVDVAALAAVVSANARSLFGKDPG